MKPLRIMEYLTNIQEIECVAMTADVQCSCGGKLFSISHTGKQTRGIFAANLVRKNKQIAIKIICSECNHSILLYDSTTDGEDKKASDIRHPFCEFVLPKSNMKIYPVKVSYNYMHEKMKSNDFVNCMVDIIVNGKEIRVLEE